MKKEKTIAATKINLYRMPVNLQDGFLFAQAEGNTKHLFGLYSDHKKIIVLKEGTRMEDVELIDSMKDYKLAAICGHFAVGYWDFDKNEEVFI